MAESIASTIAELLTPLFQAEGFELVDVETVGKRKNRILRLLIHKHGGLTVSDCKTVEQTVRPILEVNRILANYRQFEIASPGVDRPLKTPSDFQRNIGRTVQIKTSPLNGEMLNVQGQLVNANDECILLEQIPGKTLNIKISQICEGYVQLNW